MLTCSHSSVTGIPVWVGRKIHTRYKMAGKHKRNCAVLSAVTASVSYNLFLLLFQCLSMIPPGI